MMKFMKLAPPLFRILSQSLPLLMLMLSISALPTLAQTITPNLGMTLPAQSQPNWGIIANNNFAIIDTTLGGLYQAAWSSGQAYNKPQMVSYLGITYISLVNNNLNNIPATSPSQWAVIAGSGGATFPSSSALVVNTSTVASRNATTVDISTLLKTLGSCTTGMVYDPFDNICIAPTSGALFPSSNAIVVNTSTTTARNANTGDVSNLLKTISSCTAGQVYDPFDNICVAPGTGGGSPGGPSFAVQYNNSSAFGGVSAFNFQPGTGTLSSTAINSPTGLYENVPYGKNVVADGGADPTGVTDASTIFTSLATSNSTVAVPAGTYLLAATSNLTLPVGTTFQFMNGAKITTGNHGAATITSVTRPGNYVGTQTINLNSCTSAQSGTSITFTSCPNSITPGFLVVLNTSHVTPCYFNGCTVTAVTGNSFTVTSATSTTIASGAESGTAVYQAGNIRLDFGVLSATSSSGSGIITINVTNSLPAVPMTITLTGTTNVAAGTYVAIPSSVTGTGFNLVCSSCATVATAAETGRANYNPGNIDYVHFSAPLPGIGSPGIGQAGGGTGASPVGTSLGQVVCSGTTNYNGPYWIWAIADSQDIALLDARPASAATETAGTCSIPYTATFNGPIQASNMQQIVAANSAVSFSGANQPVVGWYGAQGAVTSGNDWLPIQSALFWNPGRHVLLPKISAAIYGGDNGGHADYNVDDSLTLWGSGQWLDGDLGTIWVGSTYLQFSGLGANSPGIITPPSCYQCHISQIELNGPSCEAGPSTVNTQIEYLPANDGWLNGASEARAEFVKPQCFGRDGIHFDSGNLSFITAIWGADASDYFSVQGVEPNANHGYGFVCKGNDCNNGVLFGSNDMRNNLLGGFLDQGQTASTVSSVSGEGNGPNFSAGTVINLTSLTCTGTGNTAECTGVTSTTIPAWVVGQWLTVAGTSVGDTTAAQLDTINSGTNTFTYTCPGCTGTASTGTVQTAPSGNVYAFIDSLYTGRSNTQYLVTGVVGGSGIFINPYSESTNGCPSVSASGLVLGGISSAQLIPCAGFSGVGIFSSGNPSQLQLAAGNVSIVYTPPSLTQTNMLIYFTNGAAGSGFGSSATGTEGLIFEPAGHEDYSVEETGGGNFQIQDIGDGTNVIRQLLGGALQFTAPSGQAIQIDQGESSPGPMQWFTSVTGGTVAQINPTTPSFFRIGLNLSGTASPLLLNGSAGTSGTTCVVSAGAGATPTWGSCGSGGGGTVTTSGTPTTNQLALFSGSTVIANSAVSDNGTTVTSTEPVSAPSFTASGSTQGLTLFGVGTGTISTGSFPTNYVGIIGPPSGTPAYLLQLSSSAPLKGQMMQFAAPATVNGVSQAAASWVYPNTGATTATFAPGAAGGSGATSVCATSHVCDEISGVITYTTGTGPTTGTLVTATLATRTNHPNCTIETDSTGGQVVTNTKSTSTTGFVVTASLALSASTAYSITYVCGGS